MHGFSNGEAQERGEGGELTGTKKRRGAREGGAVLGKMATALQARGGAWVGYLGLKQRWRLLWGLDREAWARGIRF